MVVVDNAHRLFVTDKGEKFLNEIRVGHDWVILLGSQLPDEKNPLIKNNTEKFNLTELPQSDAVKQLENCFYLNKKSLSKTTPPLQGNYFAYRMWFYLGGNLRAFKAEILNGDLASH